jgi:hypothetical protein
MNVVWHDHECMSAIMPEDVGVMLDGFYDHVRNFRLAQVKRTTSCIVQQSIHGRKMPDRR